MQWHLPITIKEPSKKLVYSDKILLAGSCFTEHIGNGLQELKFNVLQNPHGILFGVDAICQSLEDYISNRKYTEQDLFELNGVWNSWDHHSIFSNTNVSIALEQINLSIEKAHVFLKNANYLVLTLGSSFCYRLTAQAQLAGKHTNESVANCHRAPASWFNKELLPIRVMVDRLASCLLALQQLNPTLQTIITVSPVRHIRDGVQENNRSKARLFETIQQLEEKGIPLHYFPAYEIVIDVLRDYRFYDIDLVHPNFAATDYVIEQFLNKWLEKEALDLAGQIKKLRTAFRHRPQHVDSPSHQSFIKQQYQRLLELKSAHPFLDFTEELEHFSTSPS